MPTIEELQSEIASWADRQFPDRDIRELLLKLVQEIGELIGSDFLDDLEYADIVILVLDMAYLAKVDVGDAVKRKMVINRERRWKLNQNGTHQHIKE